MKISASLRARSAAELRFLRAVMTPKERKAWHAQRRFIAGRARHAGERMREKLIDSLVKACAKPKAPAGG